MKRQEAIDALIGAWLQRDGEFCVGSAEHEGSAREMRNALHALGVSDEEIDA